MGTTAFVMSGGGSPGAVQVGMLQALAGRPPRPDGRHLRRCRQRRLGRRARHVHRLPGPTGPCLGRTATQRHLPRRRTPGAARTGGPQHGCHLRRHVSSHAGITDLALARVPTHLVAADLLSGHDVLISTGDIVDGVLASAAIRGVLPPVKRGGQCLVDGSVALHAGVAQAVDLGATVIGHPRAAHRGSLRAARPTPYGGRVALHSLTLLIAQRLIHEMSGPRWSRDDQDPASPVSLAIAAADFGHAAQLIARARDTSLEWISSGDIDLPAPERFLALHHHRSKVAGHDVRPGKQTAIHRG
jgi:NTE family protein